MFYILIIIPSKMDDYWTLGRVYVERRVLKYDGNPMNIEHLKTFRFREESNLQLFMMFGSDDGQKYESIWSFCNTSHRNYQTINNVEVILVKRRKKRVMARHR